jgi:hypothetical protein
MKRTYNYVEENKNEEYPNKISRLMNGKNKTETKYKHEEECIKKQNKEENTIIKIGTKRSAESIPYFKPAKKLKTTKKIFLDMSPSTKSRLKKKIIKLIKEEGYGDEDIPIIFSFFAPKKEKLKQVFFFC